MTTDITQPAPHSAPERLRTFDGAEWKLRATTQTGISLYALADAPACCPPFVMATLTELAAHGIQSRELAAAVAEVGALPMPVIPEPQARIAELEAERHTTNEALSEAAEQLRADRDRIATLEAEPLAWAERLDAKSLDNLLISLGSATEHEPMDGAIDQIHQVLAGFREAALGLPVQSPPAAPELVVYRAEHDSIVFGLYTTAEGAREHCEAHERRDQPTAELDWIEDEEDGVAELVATADGEEKPTGYVVTALEVASAYDPDADE